MKNDCVTRGDLVQMARKKKIKNIYRKSKSELISALKKAYKNDEFVVNELDNQPKRCVPRKAPGVSLSVHKELKSQFENYKTSRKKIIARMKLQLLAHKALARKRKIQLLQSNKDLLKLSQECKSSPKKRNTPRTNKKKLASLSPKTVAREVRVIRNRIEALDRAGVFDSPDVKQSTLNKFKPLMDGIVKYEKGEKKINLRWIDNAKIKLLKLENLKEITAITSNYLAN